MQFLKSFLINLVFLVVLGIVLFALFPDMMRQVFELYWAIFVPIALFILVVAAILRKKVASPQQEGEEHGD